MAEVCWSFCDCSRHPRLKPIRQKRENLRISSLSLKA
jgi:hypothetical protein